MRVIQGVIGAAFVLAALVLLVAPGVVIRAEQKQPRMRQLPVPKMWDGNETLRIRFGGSLLLLIGLVVLTGLLAS